MSELRRLLQTHTESEIELASRTLTDFMSERAIQLRDELGFDWKPTPNAPDDYDTLTTAYLRSVETGEPLPISSMHNDGTIYLTPEANVAFRFVHDVHHVQFGLSFAVIDELDLANWHLSELEAEGFMPTSMPWRMLHADLIGQAHMIAVARQFPTNQRRFVSRCLLSGYERGLVTGVREVQRSAALSGLGADGNGDPRPA